MGINLVKGETRTLDISSFRVGLGWEPNEGMSDFDFDLDVSAFMIGKNKKIIADDYLVFYNSDPYRVAPTLLTKLEPENPLKYPSFKDEEGKIINPHEHWRRKTRPIDPEFAVIGSIDDMDGKVSDGGDDETMDIDLNKVRPDIEEIIIVVSIYEFEFRGQNFGQVTDSYVRIYNASTKAELYKYELNEDFSNCASIEFCRIYRRNNEWKVQALGIGHKGGLEELLTKYN